MAGVTGLTIQQSADLVNSVRTTYPLQGDIALTQQYQRYVGVELMQNRKEMVSGGQSLKATLTLSSLGTAQMVKLYTPLSVILGNVTSEIEIPWRMSKGQWSVNRVEVALNMGQGQIFELIKTKRAPAMIDFADMMEGQIWSSPASSTNDTDIWGIPYWINPLADGQAGAGFYGCAPSGHTTVGGLAAATANLNETGCSGGQPRHRNYAAGGANVYTAMDLEALDSMEAAADATLFTTPPIVGQAVEDNSFPDNRIFAGSKTRRAFTRLVRSQNDQLGAEAAPYMGGALFHGRPMEYVPFLDADYARAPIYFVPMNELHFCVPNGLDMAESDPFVEFEQSDVASWVISMTWAMFLRRRRHAAILRYTA